MVRLPFPGHQQEGNRRRHQPTVESSSIISSHTLPIHNFPMVRTNNRTTRRATDTDGRNSSTATSRKSMHSVLQLHYQIQQQSFLEKYIVLGLVTVVGVLFGSLALIRHYFMTTRTTGHHDSVLFFQHRIPIGLKNLGGVGSRRRHSRRFLRYQPPNSTVPTVRQLFEQEQERNNNNSFSSSSLSLSSSSSSSSDEWRRMSLALDMLRWESPGTFLEDHSDSSSSSSTQFLPLAAGASPSPVLFLESYNVSDCPTTHIPDGYPYAWSAMTVLRHWNPDVTRLPPHQQKIHQSLCVWDWHRIEHRAAASLYRQGEVPFVVRHHPDVVASAYRWSTPGYLLKLLGTTIRFRTEHSVNNHFMFWRGTPKHHPQRHHKNDQSPSSSSSSSQQYRPPTDMVNLKFPEWLAQAERLDPTNETSATVSDAQQHQQAKADHWYLRLNAALPNTNAFLYDELPMFQPRYDVDDEANGTNDAADPQHENTNENINNLFMVDSTQQRGINCRFGMRGAIAEAHFDKSRNWILLLTGQRRYILAHPSQCPNLELYPSNHPSGRHSAVDWSTVALPTTKTNGSRPFAQAMVQEIVLQGGDALYLPTHWFHFIVSLSTTNAQCNARSGETFEHTGDILRCGFQ